MSHEGRETDNLYRLIDLHLEQMEPEESQQFRSEIEFSAELTSKSKAVREVFHTLDHYEVEEPPPDLSDRILGYVDQQTATLPFREPRSAVPAGAAHDMAAIPVLSLRELIAIAACITLFVGIFVPGYYKVQNLNARHTCQKNLASILGGTVAYAEENKGYLPQLAYVNGGSWLRTRTPNVLRVSNTAPMYLLLRDGHVKSARVFICPSALAAETARPMRAKDYSEFDDFAEPVNVTYSFQYMNEPKGRPLEDMDPRMVLVADRNPLFAGKTPIRTTSPQGETFLNSPLHENGAGQNVVFLNGQRAWTTRPDVGVDGDDIYRTGDLLRYTGTERPQSETDNLLVP